LYHAPERAAAMLGMQRSYFGSDEAMEAAGAVRVFNRTLLSRMPFGSHACSLEALASMGLTAFLSGVHFLLCKLRPNTQGRNVATADHRID